jgi:hypothetical protein
MLMLSEMIEEKKPEMRKFIIALGYTEAEAVKFADGYMAQVLKLPSLTDKLIAVDRMDDSCMTAGFKAAGIDEDEALARYFGQFKK